jgi:hypothetical protein
MTSKKISFQRRSLVTAIGQCLGKNTIAKTWPILTVSAISLLTMPLSAEAQEASCPNLINSALTNSCRIATSEDFVISATGSVITSWRPIWVDTGADAGSLTNNGAIEALGSGAGAIRVDGALGTLTNNGTLTANSDQQSGGWGVEVSPSGSIANLINLGTIDGGEGGIQNRGVIDTLINAQSDLGFSTGYYDNNLPGAYYTYFTDTATYGKVGFSNLTNKEAAMSYGIAGGNYATGTYADVMSFDIAREADFTLVDVNGVNYQLTTADDGLTWDLVISSVSSTTPTPLLSGSLLTISSQTLLAVNQIVQSRQDQKNGLNSGDKIYTNRHVWIKPFSSWADQNDRNAVLGYEADTLGVVAGVDGDISEKTSLGLAFAFAKTDVDSNSTTGQTAAIDNYQLIGYGSHALTSNMELNVQLGVGRNNNEGARTTQPSSVAHSDYNSTTAQLGLGLQRRYQVNDTQLIPAVRADYTWVRNQAFTETGAGADNLHVEGVTSKQLTLGLEGKLDHPVSDNTAIIANLGIGRDLLSASNIVSVAYVSTPGTVYSVSGLEAGRTVGTAGLGLVHTLNNGSEITAGYDLQVRDKFTYQTASVKVRWAF